jgi:hypothetical protein
LTVLCRPDASQPHFDLAEKFKKKLPNFYETGIITKVDAVKDPEAVVSLVKILENKTLPLEKGYIGVINKSKAQVKISLKEEINKEINSQ